MSNSNLTDLFAQYNAASAVVQDIESSLLAEFNSMSLVDKFKTVLELGTDFLQEDHSYCPHVSLSDGTEISLYDDFYWERHQTCDLDDFYDELYESKTGEWKTGEQVIAALKADPEGFLNQDTPAAVLIRDMLEQNTGRATFDW